MNLRKHHLGRTIGRTMASAVVAMSIAFAVTPALATTSSDQARIEMRINDMHAKLKITPAEEAQWADVAAVMRDNANEMNARNQARMANAGTMSAVDDLKSYSEMTDAHSAEIKKFTAVFETLYASMSEAQKAEADALFRHGETGHKSMHKK